MDGPAIRKRDPDRQRCCPGLKDPVSFETDQQEREPPSGFLIPLNLLRLTAAARPSYNLDKPKIKISLSEEGEVWKINHRTSNHLTAGRS
jgi:hypothetical protein